MEHLSLFTFALGLTAPWQVGVPWVRPTSGFSQLMEALIMTLCKVMAVRQVALLLGMSDRRIWCTLDYYEAQARA